MNHLPARRRLLKMTSIFYATFSCRQVTALVFPKRDSVPTLLVKLSNIYDNTTSAAMLGKAYLERYPEETNKQRLVALICSDPWLEIRFLSADTAGLRKLLGYHVRRDFTNGQTVKLRGWVLSRTEVRLYGLAAVTRPKQCE